MARMKYSIRIPISMDDMLRALEENRIDLLVWSAIIVAGSIDRVIRNNWIVFPTGDEIARYRKQLPDAMGGNATRKEGRLFVAQRKHEITKFFGLRFLGDLQRDIESGFFNVGAD